MPGGDTRQGRGLHLLAMVTVARTVRVYLAGERRGGGVCDAIARLGGTRSHTLGHASIPLDIRARVPCGVSTPARQETVIQLILQLTEILGDIAIVNFDPLISAPGAYPTESAPIQLEAADLLFIPFQKFTVFLVIRISNPNQ